MKKIIVLLYLMIMLFSCTNPGVVITNNENGGGEAKKGIVSLVIKNSSDFQNATFEYDIFLDNKKVESVSSVENTITKVYEYKNLTVYVKAKIGGEVVANGFAEINIDKASIILEITLIPIQIVVKKPVFSPTAGTYNVNEFTGVVITQPDNCDIFYTLDGSNPTKESIKYSNKIVLTETKTIKAVSHKDGVYSDIVEATYNLVNQQVVSPVNISVQEGNYNLDEFNGIELSTTTSGAEIYYTLDGSQPTTSSSKYQSKILIENEGSYTIKAFAVKNGFIDSSVSQVQINVQRRTIDLTVTPASGSYKKSEFGQIVVTSNIIGTDIYFTIDGTEPTKTSSKYLNPLNITTNGNYVYKFKGFKNKCNDSLVVTRNYNIFENITVTKPVFNKAGGTFFVDQIGNIELSTTEINGEIYYTLDGSTPNKGSTKYASPISFTNPGTYTIKAITFLGDFYSEVETNVYVVKARPTGKIVYFKDDAGWPVHKIYYYEGTNKVADWAAMPTMEDVGNGWYKFHMSEAWVSNNTKVIFYGGDNSKRYPLDGQPGIDVCTWAEGYYLLSTKIWYEYNPDGLVVSAIPGDSNFQTEAEVLLKVTGGNIIASRYTLDNSDPKLAGTSFNYQGTTLRFGANLQENQKIYLKVYATDGTKEVSATFTYTKKSVVSDLVIHFEKPDNWSGAYVHHWGGSTSSTWTNSPAMQSEGGKWYKYTFVGESEKNLLFKDKAGDPINRLNDTSRGKEGWYAYRDGIWQWFDTNPDFGIPAKLTSNPQGGYFKTTQNITLGYVLDNKTTLVESKYTINGSDPKLNGQPFSNGTTITIGSGLNNGDTVVVKLYVSVKNQQNQVLVSQSEYTFTKGDSPVLSLLGASFTPSATTFSIWSPDSSNVKVNVDGTDYNCVKLNDFDGYTDIYAVTVSGNLHLKEYKFKINNVGVRDPYGVMINNQTGNNVVVDLSQTTPTGGWVVRPAMANREDAIVYEVHVRDFSIDPNSGVSPENRGKFAGMVQTGTTYNGKKTGIDHLKELGITHVQLLPVYDFSSGMYNWGYDPQNYNIPEEQYSKVPNDPVGRIKEFKEMVKEFHKNGIRVIMDVVYNHTASNEMFSNITNRYYTGTNDSGCGNGVNTGVPMVSRFIRDSLEYWIKEYNIDGFRFDLIGIFHYNEVKGWGEYLNQKYPDRNILMYGEPWNGMFDDPNGAQKVRLGNVATMSSGNIGAFNDQYRMSVKGGSDDKVKAYMFNDSAKWWGGIAAGMRGSLRAAYGTSPLPDLADSMFASDPEQTINYLTAHDNLCLWDKIVYSGATGGGTGYAGRVAKFGMGMILTSQGIPFIHAGDEILRTKVYNNNWDYAHNSYNAPDDYNMIRWQWKNDNTAMFNYYKDLIELRKSRPGLRLTTWNDIKNRVRTEINDSRASSINCVNNSSLPAKVVLSLIDEDNNVGNGYELAVIYNPDSNFNWTLPSGNWKKIFDINGKVDIPVSGTVTCEGTSVTVLARY